MKRIKWEYCRSEDFAELDALGQQGWELVGISASGDCETFYLKRPCPSIKEEITAEQRDRVMAGKEASL